MSGIFYYKPAQTSGPVIQEMISRSLMWEKAAPTGTGPINLGAYILSQNLAAVPASHSRISNKFLEYHKTVHTIDFLKALESFTPTLEFWESASQAQDVFNYFSFQKKQKGLNTFQFLGFSYYYLKNRADVPDCLSGGVYHFLNQFERFGRLHHLYDNNFKPITDSIHNVYNYILLSVVLSLLYAKSNHIQCLNAALKINDIYPDIIPFIDDSDKAALVLASIFLLNHRLEKFYDSRKFRLPLD